MSLRFLRWPACSRDELPRLLLSGVYARVLFCREDGPRGSEAVRVVPIRGFSVDDCSGGQGRRSRLAPARSRSRRGGRTFRRDDVRWWPDADPDPDAVLTDRSSGGGVGGNTLRFRGGSDCWRVRLLRFWRTRWDAAKETPSRPWRASLSTGIGFHWWSDDWLRSDAATNRALPR